MMYWPGNHQKGGRAIDNTVKKAPIAVDSLYPRELQVRARIIRQERTPNVLKAFFVIKLIVAPVSIMNLVFFDFISTSIPT